MSLVIVSLDTFLHSADTSCDLLGSSAIALTLERNLICHQSLIAALNLLADHVPLTHALWNRLYLCWLVVWGPPVTISHFNTFFCDCTGKIHHAIAQGYSAITGVDVSDCNLWNCLEEQGKALEIMLVRADCRPSLPPDYLSGFLPEQLCEQTLWSWMLFVASVSNYSFTMQTVIKAELNRIQNCVIQQGSNLFLMPFSPFPSELRTGWIWP